MRDDHIVADLGAGTGYYTVAAGHLVSRGKVYAVEIEQDFLTKIKHKVSEYALANIETIWGNVEKIGGTKLGDDIVDSVIASNILFQVEDKDKFIEEVKRILKPKGRVLVVDWSESPVIHNKHIIPKIRAREMFEKKGFSFERDIDAGEHHYGIIMAKL